MSWKCGKTVKMEHTEDQDSICLFIKNFATLYLQMPQKSEFWTYGIKITQFVFTILMVKL
jgi:hypothetical protein